MKTCRRKLHQYSESLKQCPECNRLNGIGWRKCNKDQFTKTTKAWKIANSDRTKDLVLRNRFGISIEQYKEMLVNQGGKCAICDDIETSFDPRANRVRDLAVDHCHITGKVRGLLCGNCNRAIGSLKDDVDRLTKALEYLKSHSS